MFDEQEEQPKNNLGIFFGFLLNDSGIVNHMRDVGFGIFLSTKFISV